MRLSFTDPLTGLAFGVNDDPVTPTVFCQIACRIGRSEETRHIIPAPVDQRRADTDAHFEALLLPEKLEVLNFTAQLVRKPNCLFGATVVKKNGKLIATNAPQYVTLAHMPVKELGKLTKQFVAGMVTAGIVDDLEVVQIHETQRMRLFARARCRQCCAHRFFKAAPIEHPR